jgi:cobalt-zinc-cadmium efflux system outer membrane protein
MPPVFAQSSPIDLRIMISRFQFCFFVYCALFAPLARAVETPPPAIAIDALVREIAARNPERPFYVDEIEAVKAAARTSTRLPEPEVSLDLGHKRLRDSAGAAIDDGMVWTVSVTQVFPWPGRLALRKAIANRDVELAELGLARFDHALAARARTLAFGLHAAHTKAEALREVAARFAALKETLLARDPAGLTPLLEMRVIEASELSLQRRATDSALALQAALLELNQLRGAPVDAPLRVKASELAWAEPPNAEALLAAARENNFEFRLRRLELARQDAAVNLARHERHPEISVRPFLSRDHVGERETIVGLGLSVPLSVTGRARAGIDAEASRRRQAETALAVAQRELDRAVLTAAHAFAAKRAEMQRWSGDAVEKFRAAAELADRHYQLGAVPIATYIELQTGYLEAVEALLATQVEALAAGLELQQLTGLELKMVEIAP